MCGILWTMFDEATRRHIKYKIKHDYLQPNTIVLVVALLLALYWAWQSVVKLQQNYTQQRELDAKHRQLKLTELETQTLQYQKNYYESVEYKELAARQKLGLVAPGEKVLILQKNTVSAQADAREKTTRPNMREERSSNLEQWLQFLAGSTAQRVYKHTSE